MHFILHKIMLCKSSYISVHFTQYIFIENMLHDQGLTTPKSKCVLSVIHTDLSMITEEGR